MFCRVEMEGICPGTAMRRFLLQIMIQVNPYRSGLRRNFFSVVTITCSFQEKHLKIHLPQLFSFQEDMA